MSLTTLPLAIVLAAAPPQVTVPVEPQAVTPASPRLALMTSVALVGAQVSASGESLAVPDEAALPEPAPAVEPVPAEQPGEPAAEKPADPSDPGVTFNGDIVVTGTRSSPGDPVAQINLVSYEVIQGIDKAVIGPVARGYKRKLPTGVQKSVHNVINNLDEPIVFVNFLLQLKPGKALETLGRFTINSTVGIGGLIDVAKKKPFNLPRRSNGLADTLGYYGVPNGPYLFLPLIGPTTVRDVIGRMLDLSLVPAVAGKPFATPYYALSKGALSAIDERAREDDRITKQQEQAVDPYTATREYYLKKRRDEIDVLKGKKPFVPEDERPPYELEYDEAIDPVGPPPEQVAQPAPAEPAASEAQAAPVTEVAAPAPEAAPGPTPAP